jgi:hypothetical protein
VGPLAIAAGLASGAGTALACGLVRASGGSGVLAASLHAPASAAKETAPASQARELVTPA